MKSHGERKHSKFPASGFERVEACPGSVNLSEGLPDKDSVWSLEGTLAHEVLESVLSSALHFWPDEVHPKVSKEMESICRESAKFILELHERYPDSEALVETRIHLPFIHPEMFGTFDAAVVDTFDTLHVIDFKYGAGHSVSATGNLQMVTYALGLAYLHHWNFKRVRMWIIQPRIKGYDGPTFWEISMKDLKAYIPRFKEAVRRAVEEPDVFVEGAHCWWCKAKAICPLKVDAKKEKANSVFANLPVRR